MSGELLSEFVGMPKIPRLFRNIVITEKIDGTNSQVIVTEELEVIAASKNRYITPASDNFGFAKWVEENKEELKRLGTGRHYGEWWGSGIQRGYGLKNGEKRFSLFNVSRWKDDSVRPSCCNVVPVLYDGIFDTQIIKQVMDKLRVDGSSVVPGYMNPEGIVVFHAAGNLLFKATLNGDEHKGNQPE